MATLRLVQADLFYICLFWIGWMPQLGLHIDELPQRKWHSVDKKTPLFIIKTTKQCENITCISSPHITCIVVYISSQWSERWFRERRAYIKIHAKLVQLRAAHRLAPEICGILATHNQAHRHAQLHWKAKFFSIFIIGCESATHSSSTHLNPIKSVIKQIFSSVFACQLVFFCDADSTAEAVSCVAMPTSTEVKSVPRFHASTSSSRASDMWLVTDAEDGILPFFLLENRNTPSAIIRCFSEENTLHSWSANAVGRKHGLH